MQQGPMSVEPGGPDILSDVHNFQSMDVQSSLGGSGGQGQSFSAGSSFSNFGGSQSNISSSMFGNHPINCKFFSEKFLRNVIFPIGYLLKQTESCLEYSA